MADTVIKAGRGRILLGNYLIDAHDIDLTNHRADYELFESYEGLISIRKMLDQHTELSFKVTLTEAMVESYQPEDDYEDYWDDFRELRRTFLDEIDGQSVVVASEMFKPFRGVVSSKKYSIEAGETATIYEIEVKEAGGSVG